MRAKLLCTALAGLCVSLARADYNPVPLVPSSFTQDIVLEKGTPPPMANFTTVTIDQGTNDYGNTFFEQGYIPSMPMLGLPPHGTTFVSASDANHTFLMPPDYRTNNCAFVGAQNIPGTSTIQVQVQTATLKVVNPTTSYTALSILYAGGGNGTNVSVTIHHADGSSEPQTIANTLDWFNGNTVYAWIAKGRISVDGSGPLNNIASTTATKLFNVDLPCSAGSPVTSIDFTWTTNAATATAGNYRVFVFAVSGATDGSIFNPIPVSGFNADAVIEAVGTPTASYVQGTTVTLDAGPNNTGSDFYEQGFAVSNYCDQGYNGGGGLGGTWNNGTYTGLPHPGSTITAANHNFVMPSSYVGNCCVFYGNYAAGALSNGSYGSPLYSTVNIALTSPQTLYGLSFLGAAGNGPAVANVTLSYNDGTTQTGSTLSMPDWFPSSGGDFVVAGRVGMVGPSLNNVGNAAVKLSHVDLTVSSQSAQVTNITLQWASGGRAAIFAVSGQTSSGGSYDPIAFSGFNGDCVVEKEQVLFPGASFKNTTATMDLGIRNGNFTWFERGWVTNGTYASQGLPPAGSTINSLLDATRHYQLPASYAGNNAILIDGLHTNVYITPASPATYSAFALLTAGASIGNGNRMYNQCILFHADGSAETNTFIGYDWFETGVSPAFISHARADTRHTTSTSLSLSGNQTPRLFESFFPVNNTGSAITNILITDTNAPTSNWTTYVLAVSATAGAVQPVLGPLVQIGGGTGAMMEGSNVVLTCSSETGTAPIANQWQFSPDGGTTWTNISDGGNFSGATTLGLTNSSIAWVNAGVYRLMASNAAGIATSPTLNLGPVYSILPDITQPGDLLVAYEPNGGSSPAAEGVANAIDNLVGTNRDSKYLNYGANGGTPFAGPVGLTVFPALGKTVVSALRVYTGNDHSERNPRDYTLEGSNDGGNTWIPIAGGALALPGTFNGPGWGPSVPPNPVTQSLQEIHFPNTTGYFAYRLSFTNAVDNSTANSIQVGEVELLGVRLAYAPVIVQNLTADMRVYAGASPTLAIVASGYPTNLTYQWYLNNSPISGATSSSYTLASVQSTDSGKSYKCVVANDQGQTPSTTAVLTVITAPTTPYATNIMRDNPLAWFRLNEGPDDSNGDNGVVAYDHYSGHNGFYTNVTLGQAGSSPLESDTAVLVGQTPSLGFVTTADSGVERIQGVDLAKPTNNSVALSVETWVKANVSVQSSDAGIVTKGYGGSEQFNLDCGGNGTAHSFRFFVRDANGATHGAVSPIAPEQDAWHHLVGVLDEANSNVLLYVDGLLSATGTVSSGVGLLSATEPMSIGSRRQNANTNYNFIFYGTVDETAVYNYALSSNQVLAHFYAAGATPRFTAQPTNTTVSEGATATFSAAVYGSPTLSAQWYQSADGGITFAPLTGKTATTLTLANVPASYDNYQYYVQVSNSIGTTNSAPVILRVISGRPQLVVDVPNQVVVYAGRTLTLPSQFLGTLPITYQWYKNGSPLANGGRISGALSDVLTIANVQTNDTGTYQVFAHNAQDGGTPTASGFATVQVQTVPSFNNTGLSWTVQTNANTGARVISGNVLTLTDGGASEATSAFYNYPLYIGGFKASFTYQDVGGDGADGIAFVLQNDPRGPAALGGAGGALGLSGITPSAALTFNIFGPNIPGIGFGLNGSQGRPYTPTDPVVITNTDPINVSLLYDGSVLSVVLSDAVTRASFSTNIAVNLPAVLGGNSAYVGFTGADGATVSTQTVGNFTFTPLPTLSAQMTSTNTVVLSWPASVGGFLLLQETGLVPSGWSLSPAVVNQVGTQYQAVVSATGGSRFYRLVMVSGQP